MSGYKQLDGNIEMDHINLKSNKNNNEIIPTTSQSPISTKSTKSTKSSKTSTDDDEFRYTPPMKLQVIDSQNITIISNDNSNNNNNNINDDSTILILSPNNDNNNNINNNEVRQRQSVKNNDISSDISTEISKTFVKSNIACIKSHRFREFTYLLIAISLIALILPIFFRNYVLVSLFKCVLSIMIIVFSILYIKDESVIDAYTLSFILGGLSGLFIISMIHLIIINYGILYGPFIFYPIALSHYMYDKTYIIFQSIFFTYFMSLLPLVINVLLFDSRILNKCFKKFKIPNMNIVNDYFSEPSSFFVDNSSQSVSEQLTHIKKQASLTLKKLKTQIITFNVGTLSMHNIFIYYITHAIISQDFIQRSIRMYYYSIYSIKSKYYINSTYIHYHLF